MAKNYQRREPYNNDTSNDATESEDLESTEETSSPDPQAVGITIYADPVPETTYTQSTPQPSPVQPTTVQSPPVSPPQTTMLPIQAELVAFAQAINPKKPVDPRWQYGVFQLLRTVIQNQDVDAFHTQWTAILNFFHTSKGTAFSDMYMLRFSDDWPGSDTEFTSFRRLVHLASETADPQTRRKNAMAINMGRVTEGFTEEAGNRLTGYYG